MAFEIDESLEIAAPAERIWQVITDLPRYGEWNPFVVACRSSLRVGEPIHMRVRILPFLVQPQRETIFEHVPGRRLCYGIAVPLGALASRRCHELEARADGTARYRSHFVLKGWLAPLVRALLGRRLERGFRAMTAAIRARAEAGP